MGQVSSGRIGYSDMFKMLKHMPPPLGLGKKCPARVAYKVDPGAAPPEAVLARAAHLFSGLSVCRAAVSLLLPFLCPDHLHSFPRQRDMDAAMGSVH